MQRFVAIVLVVAFMVFGIADLVHEFASSDGFHYFSQQPHRLLFVAAIGITGGLVSFGFSIQPQRSQRKAKLIALSSGGSFVILAGGYFTIRFARLPPELRSGIPRHTVLIILVCTIAVAGLLWLEFYQVLKRHDHTV